MKNAKKNKVSNDLLGFDLALLQQDLGKTILVSLVLLAILGVIVWQRWQ